MTLRHALALLITLLAAACGGKSNVREPTPLQAIAALDPKVSANLPTAPANLAGGVGMDAVRSAIAKPGASASTMKAEMPREPAASPVRAKTT